MSTYVNIFQHLKLDGDMSRDTAAAAAPEAQQDAEALWCHRYVNSARPAVTGRRGQKRKGLGPWRFLSAAIPGIGGGSLV